jgi:D-alanyl-D-alanine carboxypeptidase (penicillin-binding protein 5/6)
LLLKKGENAKIKREVKMDEALTAPVKAGQKIGTVTFKTADDKVVGEADIVAEKDVKKASFIRLFFRMVLGWFGIGRK